MKSLITFIHLVVLLLLSFSATTVAHPKPPCETTVPAPVHPAPTGPAPAPAPAAAPAAAPPARTGGAIDPALVPPYGVEAGHGRDQQQRGSCDGFSAAAQKPVLIPCACPPPREEFLAALARNVAAGAVEGHAVAFSTDAADQRAATNRQRGTALLVTLQNLRGPGQGCPAAAAPNFALMQVKGEVSTRAFVARRALVGRRAEAGGLLRLPGEGAGPGEDDE